MRVRRRLKVHVKVGDFSIGDGQPLCLIAGPCVVESKEIALEVARHVSRCCRKRGINYLFKSSFDKANRTSVRSFRGQGMDRGLEILAEVKEKVGVPLLTDVHDVSQVEKVAGVADILQIPAFLCRQTDLIQAAVRTGRIVNIKKGQFVSPEEMKNVVEKASAAGNGNILLTERGTMFGYQNLVADFRSLPILRGLGCPVVFDASHSLQRPGGLGHASGGDRQFIAPFARAAVAIGVDALYIEVHPRPERALSDGPTSLRLADLDKLLDDVVKIRRAIGPLGARRRF